MIISKTFGKTLEFSTVIENGSIVSQELVSSGPDALVSFKMDADAHLTPETLRELADAVQNALEKTNGKTKD